MTCLTSISKFANLPSLWRTTTLIALTMLGSVSLCFGAPVGGSNDRTSSGAATSRFADAAIAQDPQPATKPATMPGDLSVPQRVPIPDLAAQARAMKLVQEVFHTDITAAKLPTDKAVLAEKLRQAGVDETRDRVGQYVLLTLAIETAVSAGDLDSAFNSADELGRGYTVDVLQLKTGAAQTVAKSLRSTQVRKDFISKLDRPIEEAIAAGRYDSARALAELALASARQVDAGLTRQAVERLAQIREAQAAGAEAKMAADTLQKNPTDPEANLKLGKFRCFVLHDWSHGLTLLTLGSDEILKSLARLELAGASSPNQQIALGDGWWDIADKLAGPAKAAVRQRAGYWYAQAVAVLDKGLVKAKVEQRLKEIQMASPVQGFSTPAVAGSPSGGLAFTFADLPQSASLRLNPTWERLKPRKTLAAQKVTESLTLSKDNSPYLVNGFLLIEPGATLTIEPGVIVLFAPGAELENQGTLSMNSDSTWIVLAPAQRGQHWKGVTNKSSLMSARRCLFVGADKAISVDRAKERVAVIECIFAGNGSGLSIGTHSKASVESCLFFKNQVGIGTESNGSVEFTNCLVAANTKGFCAGYNGGCKGTKSTLFANEIGVESALYEGNTQFEQCNIIGNTKLQATSKLAGTVMARKNFWGKEVAKAIADGKNTMLKGKVEAYDWLEEPVKDAFPSLPACEYVTR